MKVCPNCKNTSSDDLSFCSICGNRLKQQKTPIKNIYMSIAISAIVIIVIIGIGFTISEQKKISDTKKEIKDYKYHKALEEYRNTPTTSDIRINRNWTTEKSGNYIYIKGTVTNTSASKTISYFEVEAKFYNKYGNVIDSEWTNDGDDLSPGESRKFEIMHKCNSDETDIKLLIKEVK